MADLSFYKSHYNIISPDEALRLFMDTLQTYYDVDYYVGWEKVYRNIHRFRRELLLLSSLCDEKDKEGAARALLRDYPQVIPVIPILMAYRIDERCNEVYILEDLAQLRVKAYNFSTPKTKPTEDEIDQYIHFLLTSGLLTLLSHIKSVPDYVTGVEVGMDTNARKNRSGTCAVEALRPFVDQALEHLPGIGFQAEATYAFLASQNCILPKGYKRKKWDWAFWTHSAPRRFVVVEVNHYGGSGSKPESIAAEYRARQLALSAAGVGFIWVTDGKGWLKMRGALSEIFEGIDYLVNIRLAKEGQLEWALRRLLSVARKSQEEHAA